MNKALTVLHIAGSIAGLVSLGFVIYDRVRGTPVGSA